MRRLSKALAGLAASALAASLLAACGGGSRPASPLVLSEDVFEAAPFAQCHASTIVETRSGLVAAWFGGTAEGAADVGIWLARKTRAGWTRPVEVAKGAGADGVPEPCWNPVLFRPTGGPLLLFYKVGPSPARWRGMMARSSDDGRTWAAAEPLPEGIIGPAKNHPIEMASGTIWSGSSTEADGWRVHFEKSKDRGSTWVRTAPLNDGKAVGLIQPALLRTGRRGIIAMMRSDAGWIYESSSADGGTTWTAPAPTVFPNPNAGLDAVTLRDGRHILVYNPVTAGRGVLAVAVFEKGSGWRRVLTLEEEKDAEFSYPAVIQTSDGLVHITYTWKRTRIRHVVLGPGR